MKYYTNEGKTYCVVGTVEGTVTSASGVVIASFSANEQNYFTAPAGGFVTISDDTAIVTPVFDLAPSALVGKSGGGDTPSGGKNTVTYTFAEDGTYGIEGDFSGLIDGSSMFENNEDITFWAVDLPNLTKGQKMFYSSGLVSFSGDLSNLSDGSYMFRNNKITSWNIPLPALTNAYEMFCGSNLRSFSGDLSNLIDGSLMFAACFSFSSFSGDLRSLKNGTHMFYYTDIESFNSDLSNLTNGTTMFLYCDKLTSFRGNLSSLTDGTQMFGADYGARTKLDLASVQHIADTINDLTAAGTTGTLDIGISRSIRGNTSLATALETIRSKGWTVNDYYT